MQYYVEYIRANYRRVYNVEEVNDQIGRAHV